MALSGTLETFSLPDVLRLLSSTKKTGLLALDGDRGRGRIWVRDGAIVGADADRAVEDALEGVAFELLRFVDARFEFDSGAELVGDGEPRPVDDVLAEAESRLAEWREIEAVVPSLDVWARMVTEVDGDRTVAPAQWRVLAQVGTGAPSSRSCWRAAAGGSKVSPAFTARRTQRRIAQAPSTRMVSAQITPITPPATAVVPKCSVGIRFCTSGDPGEVMVNEIDPNTMSPGIKRWGRLAFLNSSKAIG